MKGIWIIAKKELRSYFDSLVAYLLLVIFLAMTGFFTWLYINNVFFRDQADLGVFFGVTYWAYLLFIPGLTMRLFAEENKSGTIEWLLTKPVTDRQVVIGKYLATLLMIIIALAFTLPYYFTMTTLGDVDHGAILLGYLGLILTASCYIAIGIWASSLTNNQISSFLIALITCLFFHLLFGVASINLPAFLAEIFSVLDLRGHFDSISRGVLDSRDLLYFISVTAVGLFLAEMSLAKRNVISN